MEVFFYAMKLRIAIQGFEGSYHQHAADNFFRRSVDVVPAISFHQLVRMAEDKNQTEGAVMAIENSIAGSIGPNYSLLLQSNLKIVGEIYTRIHHNLMALPGTKISDLKEVWSHPMAIEQCRKFFLDYPEIGLIEKPDTALSAKQVAEGKLEGVGAIASESAAKLFDLEILEKGIETVKNNYTRFLILSREEALNGTFEANKASLHFRVSHEPGSLLKALNIIAENGLNLSKIQSFPVIKEEWKYYFHADLEFSDLEDYERTIEQLKSVTSMLNVLGVYKKGETIL